GTAPLTVLFIDISRGSPTSRLWDFGDGSTSTDLFPLHTYQAAGKYTVKLTVTNAGGSDTAVREDFITVKGENPPRAQFIAFPRQGTAPMSVLFIDLSRGSPTSRLWDFGDGATSTDMFPIHTYANPGKYTVKLTVTNSGGSDTEIRQNFIIVKAARPPKAQFIAWPRDGSAPLTVTFLDLSRGSPDSRIWDFGDGSTSTDINPVHTYEMAGKYTVTLTVANDAGSDTAVQKNFITVSTTRPRFAGTDEGNDSGGSDGSRGSSGEGNGNGNGQSGGKSPGPNLTPTPGSTERPKIKIS
ncbi:MAG TPA: PKD domain-containing protein, partial [Methanomicrobiales archaeon]|nr:PKD domain-containing protein [Methanomicrobiales archaeon]